jgi:hypothetical protein
LQVNEYHVQNEKACKTTYNGYHCQDQEYWNFTLSLLGYESRRVEESMLLVVEQVEVNVNQLVT